MRVVLPFIGEITCKYIPEIIKSASLVKNREIEKFTHIVI